MWWGLLLAVVVAVRAEDCVPPGGVAGVVVASVVVTCVVGGLAVALAWKKILRPRIAAEMSTQQRSGFAFDNPYFRDQTVADQDAPDKGKARSSIIHKNSVRSSKSEGASKARKGKSGRNHFFGKKTRALDDSCLDAEGSEVRVVCLRGVDFSGLGFNICGNMRDGIQVRDVLHRGPASESGLIRAGDRILSVTVSFSGMVYEDALTILSYASPYEVRLEVERTRDPAPVPRPSHSFSRPGTRLFHPLYRSQSIDDLTQIDRDLVGPRRSVGATAHRLTRDSLLTTGSLNEKTLANVMASDWEKRFEDTLDSSGPDDEHATVAAGEEAASSARNQDRNSTRKQTYAQTKAKHARPSQEGEDASRRDLDNNFVVSDGGGDQSLSHSVSDSAVFRNLNVVNNDVAARSQYRPTQKTVEVKDPLNSSVRKLRKRRPATNAREDENDSDVSKDSLELTNKRNMARGKNVPVDATEVAVHGNKYGGNPSHKTEPVANVRPQMPDPPSAEKVYANSVVGRAYANEAFSPGEEKTSGMTIAESNARKSHSLAVFGEKMLYSPRTSVSESQNNTKVSYRPDTSSDARRVVQPGGPGGYPEKSGHKSSPGVTVAERPRPGSNGDCPPRQAVSKNPAGMFTQISPFQVASKQKKLWNFRDESHQPNGHDYSAQEPPTRPPHPPANNYNFH